MAEFDVGQTVKKLMALDAKGLTALTAEAVSPHLPELQSFVELPKTPTGIAGAVAGVTPPKLIGEAATHVNPVQSRLTVVRGFKDDAPGLALAVKEGETVGKTAMAALEHVEGTAAGVKSQFEAVRNGLNTAIDTATKTSEREAAKAALARVTQLEQEALKHVTEAERAVAHYTPIVTEATGAVKTGLSATVAEAALKSGSAVSNIAHNITNGAAALGIIGSKAYGEMSWYNPQKYMAQARANWNVGSIDKTGKVIKNSGITFGRTMMVGGTLVGGIIGASGGKDLAQATGIMGADLDDQGKEVPTDGKLFTGLAKLGAAAALVYATVLHSGGAKAASNVAHL